MCGSSPYGENRIRRESSVPTGADRDHKNGHSISLSAQDVQTHGLVLLGIVLCRAWEWADQVDCPGIYGIAAETCPRGFLLSPIIDHAAIDGVPKSVPEHQCLQIGIPAVLRGAVQRARFRHGPIGAETVKDFSSILAEWTTRLSAFLRWRDSSFVQCRLVVIAPTRQVALLPTDRGAFCHLLPAVYSLLS
jgi:hypothetical protein